MIEERRSRRKRRVKVKVVGSLKRPRLSVFRSNKYIYAQIINDQKGITLVSASSRDLKVKNEEKEKKTKMSKIDTANKVGEILASKALKKKIDKVSFDRSWYKYHGRVKALAEGARKGGLKF